MLTRVVCALVGHRWDRHLRDGHPHKRCQRCQVREWASAAERSDGSDGASTTGR